MHARDFMPGVYTPAGLLWCAVLALSTGCAHPGASQPGPESHADTFEFVGTNPGGEIARQFVGGLDPNAPCHSIQWQIRFHGNPQGQAPTFELHAQYQVPTAHNTNRSEPGPKQTIRGSWQLQRHDLGTRQTEAYRLTTPSGRSLSLVKVSPDILHVLNENGRLAIGNGGWSYTLYRADKTEPAVDPAATLNAPEMSYKISPLSTGPSVFGVFEGRSPCQGISRELQIVSHPGCMKSKWRLTLFQDPTSQEPTHYQVEGSLFRAAPREGPWKRMRGTADDPNATVYMLLATSTQPALALLAADDNVLFFLDQKRHLLIGHGEFSYTLNRVGKR
jgi:hypothetical protein